MDASPGRAGRVYVRAGLVVVATALPTMRTQLGASLADLEWTINAYNLALGC